MWYKYWQYIKSRVKPASQEQRMHDFLSQAQSREHLEALEREWFSQHHRSL